MPQNSSPSQHGDVGYLTVRVSTAGGAIPLSGASVNIRGGDVENSSVIYSLVTNADGLTKTVPLFAPPRVDSQTPQSVTPPYSVYNVDVFANGYLPAFFHNVPVFSDVNSVQPAVLIPETEQPSYGYSRHVRETPNGGDYL